jgi:hypothetical protein
VSEVVLAKIWTEWINPVYLEVFVDETGECLENYTYGVAD